MDPGSEETDGAKGATRPGGRGSSPHSTVRVAVVDDQAPFRHAARAVVERTPGFQVVGEAVDGAEAVSLVATTPVDLVLMDIKMPVLDGIAATAELTARHPDVVVFLVSSHERSALPGGLHDGGAATFLTKEDLSPSVLAELWAIHGSRSMA